jgi:hypothetical protein
VQAPARLVCSTACCGLSSSRQASRGRGGSLTVLHGQASSCAQQWHWALLCTESNQHIVCTACGVAVYSKGVLEVYRKCYECAQRTDCTCNRPIKIRHLLSAGPESCLNPKHMLQWLCCEQRVVWQAAHALDASKLVVTILHHVSECAAGIWVAVELSVVCSSAAA